MAMSSIEDLSVHLLSDEGKLPLILQVRANAPFKKGMLLLAPAYGEVIAEDS